MKHFVIIIIVLLTTNVGYCQIPAETRSIKSSNNRETYYGNKGYLSHSTTRGNTRVYSDKRGVYSRQYKDGSGTVRFQQIRPIAGEPARSAASRGFSSKK